MLAPPGPRAYHPRVDSHAPTAEAILNALLALTRRLNDQLGLEAALGEVADAALLLLPGDHASVRVLDDEGNVLVSGARAGVGTDVPADPVDSRRGVVGWVLSNACSALINDVSKDPRFEVFPGQPFKVGSMVLAPLCVGLHCVGALGVSHPNPDRFRPEDEDLANLLANCAVPRVEQARLERLSLTDDLTRALNHRALLPRLTQEISRAERYGEPLSVALLDLDHFKRVNDEHGHLAGDQVLAEFAARVRAAVRRADLLVRWGGEEFLLILPESDVAAARATAERVRRHISRRRFAVPGVKLHQTVSIGVTQWSVGETPESLLERVDQAVYAAKDGGRDRVEVS